MLRAYPGGSPDARALVRELLDAIAVDGFPLLTPRTLRYIEAPARYDGDAPSVFGRRHHRVLELVATASNPAGRDRLPGRRPQPAPR
ncbi:hypothetical protein [Streptomyces sp. NBC_01451]|uniref:hypothetical protein n=1 Tax=Streptomyces sp. NBC_01451 TaxID=2903872 RepID=UPI002E2F8902|nr:hypothetical protein [Streptomyces sp. NBC_01451]